MVDRELKETASGGSRCNHDLHSGALPGTPATCEHLSVSECLVGVLL